MKTSKIITATIAAAVITASSFAKSDADAAKGRPSPKEVTAIMLGGHDTNNDGALDTAELANAIEGLYNLRQEAIVNHRAAMIENGHISEPQSGNGVVTFSLLPEDGAAIVMKLSDVNQDNLLHADEILVSVGALRVLDLGTRSAIARSS